VRPRGVAAAAAVVAILAAALALGVLLVASGLGGRIVRAVALGELAKAVDGSVSIGSVRGSLWRSLELRDVAFADPRGRTVLSASRIEAGYSLGDLARGRIVLRRVVVARPTVRLEQDSAGDWNVARLFRAGTRGGGGGGGRLVDLRDVRVTDGSVSVLAAGWQEPVRIEGVNLDLRRLRATHPDSSALLAEVRNVAFRLADPALRVTRGWGDVAVDGDSVRVSLERLELPGSSMALHGVLRTGGPRPAFTVSAGVARLRFADVAALSPRIPVSGGGRFRLLARQGADGSGAVEVRDADLRSGTSHLSGELRVAYDARGAVRIGAMDLTAAPLDLSLLAPPGRSLPVRGSVRGRVRGAGPLEALDVVVDAAFTDDAVAGRPVSTVRGRGRLGLGGPESVVFRRFAVTPADVSLATVGRLAPVVALRGRVLAEGVLDGPWRDAAFEGTAVHRDGEGQPSTVRGQVRITAVDTTRVFADVALDSLSFDALARSYPAVPVRGTVTGRLRLEGPVTALAVEADVSGPAGRLAANGVVGVGDSGTAVRAEGRFEGLDLSAHGAALPPTRLTGTAVVDLSVPADGSSPALGRIAVTLGPSKAAGVGLNEAALTLRLGAEEIRVDTLHAAFPSGTVAAAGALGRAGGPSRRLDVTVRADTLVVLAPALRWWRSRTGDSAAAQVRLDGEGRLAASVSGTVAEWTVEGRLEVPSLDLDRYRAGGLVVNGTAGRDSSGPFVRVVAAVDSAAVGAFRIRASRLDAEGPLDSVAGRATVGLPRGTSLRTSLVASLAAGDVSARIDEAELALPSGAWTLSRPARIALTAESIAVDSVHLRSGAGGSIVADGSLPARGVGDFHLAADSVPLADLYELLQRDTAGIGGWVTASARLSGAAASPSIEGYVALTEGRLGDFRTTLVDALFQYADRRLAVKGALWGDTTRVLGLSGVLPLDLALTTVPQRRLAGPLEIRVQADSVDLSAVDRLTPLVTGVQGLLSADVAVGGTWERPELSGRAQVTGGVMTLPALGQRWEGIGLRLDLEGNRISVTEGIVRSGGTLAIGGDVVLEDLTRPVLGLTLDAEGFRALDRRDFAGMTGTGRLRLSGPFIGATLSGSLTVDDGYLAFADLVEKRIVNLDDPEFRAVVDSNLARASEIGPSVENVFLDSLRIDNLRVAMGRSVWLRSSEANIQLAGDFTVSKTAVSLLNPYRLDGTLQTVRGTYRLVIEPTSKDFQVTRGEVRFFGTPDLNPELDIAAEHTVRAVSGADLVVRARISGTLLTPRLTLESDQRPPLSETELVSYLLFGRPSFELGAASTGGRSEQAVLQGAATLLAGRLAGQLEQTLVADLGLPLDYLAIRPGSTAGGLVGSARVEAGTRIGERTFLTVNAGLCEVQRGAATGLLGASIEYRLTGRWRLEASVEPLQQECRSLGVLPRPSTPYQVSLDLFWQRGMQ